jgi:hypothetical protein
MLAAIRGSFVSSSVIFPEILPVVCAKTPEMNIRLNRMVVIFFMCSLIE